MKKTFTILIVLSAMLLAVQQTNAQTFKRITENVTYELNQQAITDSAWMSATAHWADRTGNPCGFANGSYHNLSQSNRNVTIKVSNAATFTFYVQNSTANRQWNYSINGATPVVVTHPGSPNCQQTEVEIGNSGDVTIVFSSPATSSASVYPIAISFTPASTDDDEDDDGSGGTIEKTYFINEPFTGLTTPPWTFNTHGGFSASISNAGGTYGEVLTFSTDAAQTGSRTISAALPTITMPEDGKLTLEFDWQTGTPTASGTNGVFFRFKDSAGNTSIAFSVQGSTTNNVAFHFVNLDNTVTNDPTATSTRIAPNAGTEGATFNNNKWYHIHAELNFTTKMVETLQVVCENGGIYNKQNTPFYSNAANGFSTYEVYMNRSANISWNGKVDNFQVYHQQAVELTYGAFLDFASTIQAVHDGETGTAAYITAIKATFQAAINSAKASVNASSTTAQLEAAKAALEAALTAFNDAKTVYTSFEAAIATANVNYSTANLRLGTQFLNFPAAALATYQQAINTAGNVLSTATTATALDAAVTVLGTAYSTLYSTRIVPSGKYKIFTFGNDKDAGGKSDKRLLFVNANNQLSATTTLVADNDLWEFVKTGNNVYTMKNIGTGLYINTSETLSGSAADILFTENDANPEIVTDGVYFYYSIRTDETHYYRVESTTDGISTMAIKGGQPEPRHRTCFHFVPVTFTPEIYFPAVNATNVTFANALNTSVTFALPIATSGNDFSKIKVYRGTDVNDMYHLANQIAIDASNPKKLNIPAEIYHYGNQFTVLIPKEAVAGLTDTIRWSFTTEKQNMYKINVKPAENATNVNIAAPVSFKLANLAGFAQNLSAQDSFDAQQITISDGANNVSGIGVEVILGAGFGASATINIAHADFEYGKTYTVTVPVAAFASAEKKLAENIFWQFSTPAAAPAALNPQTYSPDISATGVPAATEISVIFDRAITAEGADFSGIKITSGTTNVFTSASISGNKLALAHSAYAAGGAEYTVTIPKSALHGLQSDVTWKFTLENFAFLIDNFTPVYDATNVESQQIISFRVNWGTRLANVDWSGVTVKAAGDPANYVFDVLVTPPSMFNRTSTVSIYTPETGLPYNKLITVTVPKTAIPAQGGYELKNDIVWSFTTEEFILLVNGKTPAENASNVAVDAEVKVTFNHNVATNGAPVLTRIKIEGDGAMGISASVEGNAIKIAHAEFKPNTEYKVTVPAGAIKGYDAKIEWTFKTADAVIAVKDKTPTGEGVMRDEVIKITFSKNPYLNGEPDWSLVTVKNDDLNTLLGGVFVSGAGLSGNIYTVFHNLFDANTNYTVTIPVTAVKGLEAPIIWSFKTGAGFINSANGVETAATGKVSVFPTFTDGVVLVNTAEKAEIRLCDLTGKTLEIRNSAGGEHTLNIADRARGIYFVVVKTYEGTSVTKVIRK